MEHLGWCPVVQGPMRPLVVVEPEVGGKLPGGVRGVGVGYQVHLQKAVVVASFGRS